MSVDLRPVRRAMLLSYIISISYYTKNSNLGCTKLTDRPMSTAGTFCPHFGQTLVVIYFAVLNIGYVVLQLM